MIRNLLFATLLLLPQLYLAAQKSLLRNDAVEITPDLSESPVFAAPLPANGVVSGYHSEGRYRFTGKMRNKMLHGNWTSWYSTAGTYEEGRFNHGLPDGSWKVWHENGQLKYLRTYSSDQYRRIRQEFRNPHPRMVLFPITRLYLENKTATTRMLNAQYQFSSGISPADYQPVFTEAALHGPYQTYSEEGVLLESGQYRNGLREGVWKEKDLQGNTWTGNYRHNQREGNWKCTSASNQVVQLVEYRNGKIVWQKNY